MRTLVTLVIGAALSFLSTSARADVWDNGCVIGPMDSVSRCTVTGAPATGLAAVAAPILVAGAIVTIAEELNKTHQELPPGTVTQPNKKPSLSYVPPTAEDPYRNQPERSTKPNPAFNFNDKATNIATAVTAAALVGAIVGTIASDSAKHGKR
jgi:hypothetical protein